MGRLGYQSDAQSKIAVSYNSLQSYASSLHDALTQPHPAYEQIGIRNLGGEYNQLATSLLQIENEFYGTIRPKRVIRSGERPLHALRERGVEYVEVRCMDLDPFEPVGIAASTMRVLDVFLLHCLLSDSPPDSPEEIAALSRNQHLAASRGREDGLTLERAGRDVTLVDWAAEILEQCGAIAAALDAVQGGSRNRDALSLARQRLTDAQALPSARVLQAIEQTPNRSYTRFVRQQGEASRTRILDLPFSDELAQRAARAAEASLAEQARIEAADELPFETFRQRYVAAETLLV
jgi:glutamate--cysteine ligase